MSETNDISRRNVLKGSAAAAAAIATLGTNFAHAQGSDTIKVGLIGCGGRASGAIANSVEAAGIAKAQVQLVSACDVFEHRVKGIKEKYKLSNDKAFVGLDAYKAVIDSGVDMILTATPPGFRPIHFKAAVEAGKHIFFEKPVAVDPAGIRIVIEASKLAEQKKLGVVTGTQRRHQKPYIDCINEIHEGAIGDIVHMSVYWNGGGIWHNKRQPGMSDVEAQINNWYHYVWLCGDQIVEQHVHNLDVANWVLKSHPISAYGMGGRQVRDRLGQVPGQIWDNFAVEYEYPNGARVMSMCRHWPQSDENVSEFAIGTKGTSNPGSWLKPTGGETKRFGGGINPYVQEHVDLINSIKAGKPLNEGIQVAESTMTAIMGRMSAYTGKKVTWDFAMNKSTLDTMPKNLDLKGSLPEPPVPQPGIEKLV